MPIETVWPRAYSNSSAFEKNGLMDQCSLEEFPGAVPNPLWQTNICWGRGCTMEYSTVSVQLQHAPPDGTSPPAWVLAAKAAPRFWYYENEHGEQWVAKLVNEVLLISGLDIGWQEIRLSLEEAEAELQRISDYLVLGKAKLPATLPDVPDEVYRQVAASFQGKEFPFNAFTIGGWTLEKGETHWLASVILSALPVMRFRREKRA